MWARCLRAAIAALLTVGAFLIATTAAEALPGLTVGLSAGADPVLATASSATEAFWIPRAQAVDAQMVRLNVQWDSIAPARRPAGFDAGNPASPGYTWSALDGDVRELAGAGFKLLITVVDAPRWAEAANMPRSAAPGTWRPIPADLGAFASAIATRYSGRFPDPLHPGATLPRVRDWEVWDEPNLALYLTPQWIRTRGRWQPESPTVYRAMLNVFYAGVKRVSPSDLIIQGGTAPYGDPPGNQRMRPVVFDQALFCLSGRLKRLSCPDPAHLDAIAHDPYGIGGPLWHALYAGDVAVPDVYKLTRVLHAAERAGTVRPRGAKAVWVTEVSWDTKPPDPKAIPIQEQARWLEQAFYVLWRQDVSTVLWWQLADSPPIPNYADTYQAGVFFLDGRAKPGATAFRFPFITNRVSAGEIEAWGRAPESGTVSIALRSGGRWRVVRRFAVRTHQVFQAPLSLHGKGTLRAQIGGQTSLAWNQAG